MTPRRKKGLADFEAEWGQKLPAIASKLATRREQEVIPFFRLSHQQCAKIITRQMRLEKPEPLSPKNHQKRRGLAFH